ncbi:hypothetical protein ASG43_07895 [Aureimonas sp. Leaf454]|uniref:hypothetical protein n=1 Tax=Aureimonas sp. Leaf454 TaxID=1736381 RepID=UPI0006FF7226|nr:hypothetical protein [Aureimonas sp. Leaf454]KQT48768.1 hypothetical protein ASG43_07895 [Aureimonas sp. Leaf454]
MDPNTPIRLKDIVALAFPLGGMTLSGLRCEARKGRLTILRVANKDYTTLNHIKAMMERCVVPPVPQPKAFIDKSSSREAAMMIAKAVRDGTL